MESSLSHCVAGPKGRGPVFVCFPKGGEATDVKATSSLATRPPSDGAGNPPPKI